MKKKIVIFALVLLAATVGFIIWRNLQVTKKIPTPKKIVSAPAVKKKPERIPARLKKFPHPKVAIVMDDFGYNMSNLETFFSIKKPITLSVLPGLRYSAQIADLARARGYEVILHLPLEAHRKDVVEEVDTIRTGMSDGSVLIRLRKEISEVPGLSGVSNHMGSKATEDKQLMPVIFAELKKDKLYFFDSLTSQKSVCREAAKEMGLRYARRDMFLDNSTEAPYIEKQLLELEKFAFRNGKAIAVCHDRKNTVKVLAKFMPEMARDGVEFVFLSEMVVN